MSDPRTTDGKIIRPNGWAVDRRYRGTAVVRWLKGVGVNTAHWPNRVRQQIKGMPLIDVWYESSKEQWAGAMGRARDHEAEAGKGRGAITLRLTEKAREIDGCVFLVPAPTMRMLLECWWEKHGNREDR